MKILGLARIIDSNDEDGTCRVRLYDESGLPSGAVLTDVKIAAAGEMADNIHRVIKKFTAPLQLSNQEMDTIAGQNLLYNTHNPVVVE